MVNDVESIHRQVSALPPSGGKVYFYSWDRPMLFEHLAALKSAAFRRGFAVVDWHSGQGHGAATLVARNTVDRVRVCAGARGAGRRRARQVRQRCAAMSAPYRYRDRLAQKIGWVAAIRDPLFQRMLEESDAVLRRFAHLARSGT